MVDILSSSTESIPDRNTGKPSVKKTGGRRKHNMPSKKECAIKFGVGTKAYEDCINYRKGTQKGGTSAKEEQSRTKGHVLRGKASREMKKIMRRRGLGGKAVPKPSKSQMRKHKAKPKKQRQPNY